MAPKIFLEYLKIAKNIFRLRILFIHILTGTEVLIGIMTEKLLPINSMPSNDKGQTSDRQATHSSGVIELFNFFLLENSCKRMGAATHKDNFIDLNLICLQNLWKEQLTYGKIESIFIELHLNLSFANVHFNKFIIIVKCIRSFSSMYLFSQIWQTPLFFSVYWHFTC